jgi:hypothetical protein
MGGEDAGQLNIVFATDITPDKAIIHDNESFKVQWNAYNDSQVDSPEFSDLLVITEITDGCPGSDDQDYPVVYDSETDGDSQDYLEQPLAAGAAGSLMQPTVGPFPAGSYRLTVTLAKDLSNTTSFNCIEIIAATI